MHPDTANAIVVLLSLFTAEEKEGLKIVSGERTITLEQQFIGRWCYSKPRYLGDYFLYRAAHIVNGHRLLFHKVIEFNRQEFQDRLKTIMMNPDSYVKVKSTKTDNINDSKAMSMGQTSSRSSNRSTSKARMGSSESGQEYVELDKQWDKEDADYLHDGLERNRLEMSVNVDPTKQGLDGVTMTITNNPDEIVKDFAIQEVEDRVDSHDPALQSINVNQTRVKAVNETHNNTVGLNNQHSTLDGRVVAKEIADFEAIQMMTSTKFKDPRETAYQKLDILFTAPCH